MIGISKWLLVLTLGFTFVHCTKRPTNVGTQPLDKGSEVGNGGNAVVCKDERGKTLSVRVLDYYEAKVLRDTHYTLGTKELSVIDKVKLVSERLKKYDSKRAKLYQDKANSFFQNVKFHSGVKLSDTKDYGYVPIPSNCAIEQLCIQKKPSKTDEKLYTINLDLWDKLDEDHKAGLVLHEILYGEALEWGHKDSVRTRYFNGLISSSKFETYSQSEYDDLVRGVSFKENVVESPVWVSTPVLRACATKPFEFDLGKAVNSPSSRSLAFEAQHLPTWLSLGGNGTLSGTPKLTDVGETKFEVRVVNSAQGTGASKGTVTVVDCNQPDISKDPVKFRAKRNVYFVADLRNINGMSEATFSKIEGPSWLSVNGNGLIYGTPVSLGEDTLLVQIKKKLGETMGRVVVKVMNDAVWTQDPIDLGHQRGYREFSLDLAKFVISGKPDSLSFTATGLPHWMKLTSSGQLTGTPSDYDRGIYSGIVFTVTDETSTHSVSAMGRVLSATQFANGWLNGKMNGNVGDYSDEIRAMAVQSDGKIIAVGRTGRGAKNGHAVLMRFGHPSGLLDSTFGLDGIMTTNAGFQDTRANGVAITPDEKIVVTGTGADENTGAKQFFVSRYHTNGVLDLSFNSTGITTAHIEGGSEGRGVVVQPDKKIVVAGFSGRPGQNSFTLARFGLDGDRDSQFGTAGIVTTNPGLDDQTVAIALQKDGKIVAGGTTRVDGKSEMAAARYNQDGTLDTSFNSVGIVSSGFENGDAVGTAVLVQEDSKIVVTGYARNSQGKNNFALVRFDTDGTHDMGFGNRGKVFTAADSGNDEAFAADIQKGGRILLAGRIQGTNTDFCVARYEPNGTLDTSFNGTGIVTNDFKETEDSAFAVKSDAVGNVVTGGRYVNEYLNYGFAFTRHDKKGKLVRRNP